MSREKFAAANHGRGNNKGTNNAKLPTAESDDNNQSTTAAADAAGADVKPG